jgi:hypothetical protein
MDMNEKLQQYQKAIEQEFALAQSATDLDLETIKNNTASKLLQAVPNAVERILYLLEHAEKDTTQLSAAKFIIANALGKEAIGDTTDPLTNLLKELQANKVDGSE